MLKDVCKRFSIDPKRARRLINKYSTDISHFKFARRGKPNKRDLITKAIKDGKSNKEIVSLGLCSYSNRVSNIRKELNLPKSPNYSQGISETEIKIIQEFYDNGNTIAETAKYVKRCPATLTKLHSDGKFKTRTPSEAARISKKKRKKLSEETKSKIREAHILYMQKNPEKTAWSRRHKHEKSFPEKIFEDELNRCGITGWEYDFRVGIYRYDFAFPKLKLDVEIDDSWHNSKKQMQKDKLRDEFSKKNGWTVVRFTAKEVLSNLSKCIEIIKQFIEV